jgi:phage terminase large subunit
MRSPSKSSISTSLTDPVHFAGDVLGSSLWRRQRDIMRAVATKPLVAVKACHASGKTYQAARLALFWLMRYPEGKVINTAPGWRQVRLMWDEIRLARRQSRIAFPEPSATELRITDANYIQGISTNEAVKFQGIHGRNILIIADEAPGIRADIWDAIEGVRAGGDVHVLMLGNPVIPSGYFFNAFGRGRAVWDTCTISAFDTPNLAGVTMEQLLAMSDEELAWSPAPYLVTRRWVKERALAWGEKHPMFCARVLGEFPSQSAYSVFSLELIERAKRDPTPQENERLKTAYIQVGIDVAGPGEDETVVVVRSGGCVLETHAFAEHDPRGRVAQVLGRWQRTGRLRHVVVDVVGIGYNFALHLADLGFPVVQFNAGFRPIDTERFTNLKAEAYWGLREHMESGAVCGLNDLETEAQLSAILYRATPSGKTEIESKEDARKRGQSSPDRAEALVMAFCRIVPREQTVYFGERVQISAY